MNLTQRLSVSAPRIDETTGCRKGAVLRPLLLSASIVLAFAAAPAGAVDEHHPDAAGSRPPAGATAPAQVGPTVEKMQENVRQMQSQLERVAAAKTDEERRAALADHMQTMQANMMLAMQAVGKKIRTVESLAGDAVPNAFVACDAQQCGFCTPGFVVGVRAFLNQNPKATEEEIRKGLNGNLCRCGTYANIIHAAVMVVKGGANG